MIKIKNLVKSFGSLQVLKGIDLQFEAGQVYGIVGENGAGKTTLFRCIAGLEEFDGSIESSRKPLKNHLGLLFTDPFFFSKITGKEYIQFVCQARGLEVNDFDSTNIFELPLEKYASSYSTGMKKKLAITALLFQGNDYFILDEPFNGVDIEGNILLTDIIHQLRDAKKTVLISSHIFATLKETCDQIHLLQDGLITKSVDQSNFHELESEMKEGIVKRRIQSIFKP